jgi:hypothetical protein
MRIVSALALSLLVTTHPNSLVAVAFARSSLTVATVQRPHRTVALRSPSTASPPDNDVVERHIDGLRGGADEVSTDLRIGKTVQKLPLQPTMRQYIQFALPCLALWVAGPLLSLVDTSFIGLSAPGGSVASTSAQQLAALGPATTLYVVYCHSTHFIHSHTDVASAVSMGRPIYLPF